MINAKAVSSHNAVRIRVFHLSEENDAIAFVLIKFPFVDEKFSTLQYILHVTTLLQPIFRHDVK